MRISRLLQYEASGAGWTGEKGRIIVGMQMASMRNWPDEWMGGVRRLGVVSHAVSGFVTPDSAFPGGHSVSLLHVY